MCQQPTQRTEADCLVYFRHHRTAGFRNAWAALHSQQDRNNEALRVRRNTCQSASVVRMVMCWLSCFLDFSFIAGIRRLLRLWQAFQLHGTSRYATQLTSNGSLYFPHRKMLAHCLVSWPYAESAENIRHSDCHAVRR